MTNSEVSSSSSHELQLGTSKMEKADCKNRIECRVCAAYVLDICFGRSSQSCILDGTVLPGAEEGDYGGKQWKKETGM